MGHRGFLQLDCFLTSFALPPLALSDSYFSLTGGSVLMMVMSGDILQVVHRMHAAVGECLPLVAHLRAVNSQCVVGLVVAAAAGVWMHLHHFVVPVHDRCGRHEHVRVWQRPRHGLLAVIGAPQGEHLIGREQRVPGVQSVGRQQLLLGEDAPVVRGQTAGGAAAVRWQAIVPVRFGAGGRENMVLGHGALHAFGLLALRRRIHVQLDHVRLQVAAARRWIGQMVLADVVLVLVACEERAEQCC